jgi:hypothetical protein
MHKITLQSFFFRNLLLGDLHPREGKYGHAAVFGLQPSSYGFGDSDKDAEKQYPSAAMVNFTKPGKD